MSCVVFKLVRLRGNRILVPFGFFSKFLTSTPVFVIWVSPSPGPTPGKEMSSTHFNV